MRRIGNKAWLGVAAACGALLLLAGPAVGRVDACAASSKQSSRRWAAAAAPARPGNTTARSPRSEDQISTARSRARRAGCGFSFLSIGPQMCGPLKAQIDKHGTQSRRACSASAASWPAAAVRKRDRQRILASLDANDCRDKVVAERQPARERNGTFFDRLFGGSSRGRASGRAPRCRHRPRPRPER